MRLFRAAFFITRDQSDIVAVSCFVPWEKEVGQKDGEMEDEKQRGYLFVQIIKVIYAIPV
jgi:hypothetical protein